MKTDIRVVEIDLTHHWSPEMVEKCGGQIKTVYMYDANVQIRLCEITPSYELTPLYYNTAEEVSEETHDELMRELSLNDSETYYHCHVIDALDSVSTEQDFEFESCNSDDYKEGFESAREYCNGNHLIC